MSSTTILDSSSKQIAEGIPAAGPPANEVARLEALARYRILDSETEEAFDELTALAAHVCEMPMASISLVDRDRQWFKSRIGISERETPRGISFCTQAIQEEDLLVVADAKADNRFASSPLVTGGPKIRSYAGAPLVTPEGYAVGSLCVMDRVPRELRADQLEALRILRNQVIARLELRRVLLDERDAADEVLGKREEALRWREDRFRSLVRATAQIVVAWDVTGDMVEELPTWGRFTGQTFEEYRGRGWLLAIHPDDRKRTTDAWTRALETREVHEGEFRLRAKDGSYGEFWVRVAPVLEKDGGIREWVGTCTDLAPRKRAEEALRNSAQRVHALMEGAKDAIFVVTPEGILLETNRAGEELHGQPRAEMIGRHFLERLPREERELAWSRFKETVVSETSGNDQAFALRADGRKVPIEITASPVEIGGEKLVFVIARDVSERRHLEEQFRQSQKMEAIGRLAGGVAHDFNNLLTVILGYAEALVAGRGAGDGQELVEIGKAAQRAADLTRQMLAFSRRQVFERRIVDVNRLVRDMDKMLRRLIGEDVELTAALDPDLAGIRADAGQIEQVIMNLVVNGRDAMPAGGRLTIETRGVDLDDTYARDHLSVKPGRYVMLAVSDTGTGMDAETKSRIFEPFFTTKEAGRGTGLGLATVYGIIKQTGGEIWVYSEPGLGTTFKIYFPEAPRAAAAVDKPAAPPLERGTETILLTEDEEAVRVLARKMLAGWGYRVLEAANVGEAMEIASRSETIDLLLTDIVMPDMSGSDLAARVRKARPETRVLYMSGYTDDVVVRHGVLEKGSLFLQKPFTAQNLARKVREALGTRLDPGATAD